jgi:hypothetical protein
VTFVKPSTVSTGIGAYDYKGSVGYPSQNYIDNNFPNILDKTGDTVNGNIVFNGVTTLNDTVLGGPLVSLDTTLYVNGGYSIQVQPSGYVNIQTGGSIFLNGAFVAEKNASVTMATGAGLMFDQTSVATGSVLKFVGSEITTDSGSTMIVSGNFQVDTQYIAFGFAQSDPTIIQAENPIGSGQNLAIHSQDAPISGDAGGLLLQGGNSGSGNGGDVSINGGSGNQSGGNGGTVSLGNYSGAQLSVGSAGLAMGHTTISVTNGTYTLSAAEWSNPWIIINPASLTGNVIIRFPNSTVPSSWFVSAGGVTFSSYSISFKTGTLTAGTTLTAAGSTAAIVMVDNTATIFATGAN